MRLSSVRAWQIIIGADGAQRELGGIDGCAVSTGDLLVLETPGGGDGDPES